MKVNLKLIVIILAFFPCFMTAQKADLEKIEKRINELLSVSGDLLQSDDVDIKNATKSLENAEKLALKYFGSESRQYGMCLINRGLIEFISGNSLEAQKLYLRAKSKFENLGDTYSYQYYLILYSIATIYNAMGLYDEAEVHYMKSLSLSKNFIDDTYSETIKACASFYYATERYSEAEPLYSEYILLVDETNPGYLGALILLADIKKRMERYEESIELLVKSKNIILHESEVNDEFL